MNWTEEDLDKPQVLVDSAYGMGHPGTFHFRPLIEEVSNGVFEVGGKPAVFTVSDICDGVAQAHEGMSYSLVSRDIMAAMIEIHALGHPHDGMVLISGNDKSVPAHLLAIARCNMPAIHLPGGTQLNAPDYVTSDQLWPMGMAVERGELSQEDFDQAQHVAKSVGRRVFARKHGDDAGHLGYGNSPDARMRVRRAHHHGMRGVRQREVVGVASSAAQQRVVFDAREALT